MRASTGPFREHYVEPYWTEGKCGFKVIHDYDKSQAIPCIYDNYIILSGYTVALKKGGKWGILSHKNEIICDFRFDRIEKGDHWSKLCIAMKEGNWGLIDVLDGSSATGFKYDFARPVQKKTVWAARIYGDIKEKSCYDSNAGGKEQYWLLYTNGRVFIFGDDGNMLYHSGFEDMIGAIQIRLCPMDIGFIVQDKGKFGILKEDGDFLCKCEFDEIKELYGHIINGNAFLCHVLVRKNEYWGLINCEGEFILRCEFDEIKTVGSAVAVKHNNKWGIIPFTELMKYDDRYGIKDKDKIPPLSFWRD